MAGNHPPTVEYGSQYDYDRVAGAAGGGDMSVTQGLIEAESWLRTHIGCPPLAEKKLGLKARTLRIKAEDS